MTEINDLSVKSVPDLTDEMEIQETSGGASKKATVGSLWKKANTNEQTGTTYTLVLADAGKLIVGNHGTGLTITIPANSSVDFPVDTVLTIIQYGAGTVTVTADTGVTLNGVSTGSGDITAQYAAVTLWQQADDNWVMFGNHGGVS